MGFFRTLSVFGVVLLFSFQSFADERLDLGELYKVTTMRAAPGKLENLIDYLKSQRADGYYQQTGQLAPMIMRHSQGDHWDLFLLQPIGSYQDYFGRPERPQKAELISKHRNHLNQLVVFQDTLFAYGPNRGTVQTLFSENALFHLELFAALAGKHDELLDQRVRENGYLDSAYGYSNLIFVGDLGNDIDVFTIGFYRDLMDFADQPEVPEEDKLRFAQENGFKTNNHIGFNLREFLSYHQDTLARKVE